jgi:uncharacterized phage-associated protein
MADAKSDLSLWMIIYHCPGITRTSLNKLIFLVDALSIFKFGKAVTNFQYVKLDFGPVPEEMNATRKSLIEQGFITENQNRTGPYYSYTYSIAGGKPEKILKLYTPDEIQIIKRVCDEMGSEWASTLSDLTHTMKPWQLADWGKPIKLKSIVDDRAFNELVKQKFTD